MWVKKSPAVYKWEGAYCDNTSRAHGTKRKPMKRPPALYVVYAKCKHQYYCGFIFANVNHTNKGLRFMGFRFENYKRAIEYTRRFRSEWAALNEVKRLDAYYNKNRKDKIIFKAFKIEAEEEWDEARERWKKEYNALKVPEETNEE